MSSVAIHADTVAMLQALGSGQYELARSIGQRGHVQWDRPLSVTLLGESRPALGLDNRNIVEVTCAWAIVVRCRGDRALGEMPATEALPWMRQTVGKPLSSIPLATGEYLCWMPQGQRQRATSLFERLSAIASPAQVHAAAHLVAPDCPGRGEAMGLLAQRVASAVYMTADSLWTWPSTRAIDNGAQRASTLIAHLLVLGARLQPDSRFELFHAGGTEKPCATWTSAPMSYWLGPAFKQQALRTDPGQIALPGIGEIVAAFQGAGGWLDAADERGRTLLHLAARAGAADLVRLALVHGANPLARDIEQRDTRAYAAGHPEVEQMLGAWAAKAAAHEIAARAGLRP